MRGLIILTVLAFSTFWAYDAYQYDGGHSHDLWQQVVAEGQHFSDQVQRQINGTLSGR